jgi:FKBP-type peptidyl-prolyl cis-trans isomerase FklB
MVLRWLTLIGVVLLAAQVSAAEKPVLKTQQDKVNYGIGVYVGRNFKQQKMDLNLDLVIQGLKDEMKGEKLLLDENELKQVMTLFQAELRKKQKQAMKAAGEDNKKEGDAFLAENKKKEGVVTLPSGLQYKVLTKGEGKKPAEKDTVEVQYRGTLINGTEFDSSQRRGKAAVFKVSDVIPGWREALQLMPVGSKWQLVVPPMLAYGERGAGQQIGPNATLIFEVELLGIK